MQEVEHNNMLQSGARCVDCLQKMCVHSLTVSTWVMSQIRVKVKIKDQEIHTLINHDFIQIYF